MYLRNSLLLVLILFLSLSCKEKQKGIEPNYALLALDELANLPQEKILFVDFRNPEAFASGHIPGALNLWRNDIEDGTYPYRGMLARKDSMEALLGSIGITNEHKLVLYDESGLPGAARLWWALKHYGFQDVSLLNGGLDAWKSVGKPLETIATERNPTTYRFPDTDHLSRLITKDELLELLESGNQDYIILDARSREEFLGSKVRAGMAKGGHIPNAVNIDWAESTNLKGNKKFKSLSELQSIFAQLKASKGDKIIVYCHSGVRSSHTYFVLTELLGYENVWNYDGSWTEWSRFELPYVNNQNMLIKN